MRHIIPEYNQVVKLRVHNQAAIEFVKSPVENHRSKHTDVKHFFIRYLYYKGEFDIWFVRSKSLLLMVFLNLSPRMTF